MAFEEIETIEEQEYLPVSGKCLLCLAFWFWCIGFHVIDFVNNACETFSVN
jgi:hypothetical protein